MNEHSQEKTMKQRQKNIQGLRGKSRNHEKMKTRMVIGNQGKRPPWFVWKRGISSGKLPVFIASLGPSIPFISMKRYVKDYSCLKYFNICCTDLDSGRELLFFFKWKDWESKEEGRVERRQNKRERMRERFTDSNNYTNSLFN